MPPSQDQDLHVIELTELIEQGKPPVTASADSTGSGEAAQEGAAVSQGAVALSGGRGERFAESRGTEGSDTVEKADGSVASAGSGDSSAGTAQVQAPDTGTAPATDTATGDAASAWKAARPAQTRAEAGQALPETSESEASAASQVQTRSQAGTISPLMAGMLPGLVDKISGLSHECSLLHERMEQIALRQNRLDEACRLRAGSRNADSGTSDPADLESRLKALEEKASAGSANDATHEHLPAALAMRLSDCEEQLALFATREDMDREHKELLACVDNLMAQCKEEGDGLRRQMTQIEARVAAQEEQARAGASFASTDDVRQVRTVMEQCLEQQAAFKCQQEQIGAQVAGLQAGAERDRRQMESLGSALDPLRASLADLLAQRISREETESLHRDVQNRLEGLQTRLSAAEDRVNQLGSEEQTRLEALQVALSSLQQMVREQHDTLSAQIAGEREERSRALDELAFRNGEEARSRGRELEEQFTALLDARLQERSDALNVELSALNGCLAREEEREKALTTLQEQVLKARDAHAACLKDVALLQTGVGDAAARLRRLEEALAQEREERRQGLATLGTSTAENGRACREDLAGVQAMALKLAEDQSVLSARLSVAEDKLATAPSSLSQLVDSASQQVGQKVLEDLSDFIRNFVTTHTTAYEERLTGLEDRLEQSLAQEQVLRQSLEEQRRINQDLTARLQALETRVSEEALEQSAARACVRILREEIGRLLGGSR